MSSLSAARGSAEPLTIFTLAADEPVATFTHTRPLRQGRVVTAAGMQEAIEAGVVEDLTWDGVTRQ